MLRLNKILDTTSLIIVYGLALTVPFSMAASSFALVGMGVLIIGKLIDKEAIGNIHRHQRHIVWALIPLIYFISLAYSRNFQRGCSQWQILLPLIILPLFFEFFTFKNIRIKPASIYILACVVSILLHLVPYTFWPSALIKSLGPSSLFYSPTQNSWIWWVALMSLVLKPVKMKSDQLWMVILVTGLMYFGKIGLLLTVYIMYVIKEWKEDRDELSDMLTRVMIFLPLLFISGWIFFSSFQNAAVNTGDALLSLYTGEDIVGPVKWFITDALCSAQQWWLHPFSGDGIGDYKDAMWNQYQSIRLEAPASPYQQLGHMMVSGGISFLIVFYFIWNAYRVCDRYTKSLVTILLVTMIFFAPFISQISAFVFLLPLFFTDMSSSNE